MKIHKIRKYWMMIMFTAILGSAVSMAQPKQSIKQTQGSTEHPRCKVTVFGTETGLPASVISGLAQTSDNLIWMTSWNGLSCFDGYRFSTFRNIPGNDVLTSNHLMALSPAVRGNLWTRTYTGEIYMFDSHRCEYVNVTKMIREKYKDAGELRKTYSLANGHTWIVGETNNYRVTDSIINDVDSIERFTFKGHLNKVCLDCKGREWCFTSEATYVDGKLYSNEMHDFVAVQNGRTWLEPQKNEKVNAFIEIDGNHIAIATDNGVVIIDTRNGVRKTISVQSPGNPVAEVKEMFLDRQGRLWCFNDAPGVTIVTQDGKAEWMNTSLDEAANEMHSDVPMMHIDRCGTVWVMPTGGTLSYYDEAKKTLVPYPVSECVTSQMFIPRTKSYFSDSQGNLWLIQPHNLSLVNFLYSNVNTVDRGDHRETRAVCQTLEGNIAEGTVYGDLVVYDKNGQVISTREKMLKNIYCISMDSKHNMWIGSKGEGIIVTKADGSEACFRSEEKNGKSLIDDNVYDIQEDHKGRIWIATFGGGLCCYKEDFCKFDIEGNFKKIRRIDINKDGIAMLSTTNGLVCFDSNQANPKFFVTKHKEGDEGSLFSDEVMQTCHMKDGRVYVATLGGGLQMIVSKNLLQNDLRMKGIDTQSIQTIQGLVADNSDNLWIIGESRIARLDKKGILTEFGADELGDVNITEARPSHNPKSDMIVIATEGGSISFYPHTMKKSNYQPSIVFTSVNYQDNLGMQPLLNRDKLEVDVNHRTFTVSFSALDYSNNANIRYAYRMDDDDKWVYTRGGANSVSFSRFPAGNHVLYVKSTNSDGVWVDNVRELKIYASPTFFESWWGRLIMLLILIGAIAYGVYRYMHKKKQEITEEAVEQADAGKVRFLLQTPEIIDEDKELMDKLLGIIEKRIGDSDLKVDDLAEELGMSRTSFYTRIKKIADMTPNDFLRHVRMQRGEELVSKSQLPFSQIAYKIGFSDPKYFSKCFKKHTGMSPSEYRAKGSRPTSHAEGSPTSHAEGSLPTSPSEALPISHVEGSLPTSPSEGLPTSHVEGSLPTSPSEGEK